MVHRSDALARLMDGLRPIAVAGTHGKTTTTSMLAVSLSELGLNPSYAIGGDLDAPGLERPARRRRHLRGRGGRIDRSFHKYAPEVAIILNVELDHHANYASMDEIYESFETFVGRIVPGGTLVISADHEGARELHAAPAGLRAGGDVRASRRTPTCGCCPSYPQGLKSEVTVHAGRRPRSPSRSRFPAGTTRTTRWPRWRRASRWASRPRELAPALAAYTGVKRRLQLKGEAAGVQVIDSYAHHPTEMTADLEAMRAAVGEARILVVFQPHLFSRTQELGKEMGESLALADASVVLDIYPAREDPIPGVTSTLIIDAARAAGADVTAVSDKAEVPEVVAGMAKPGDLVLTMGAGDVTDLGPRILDRLAGDCVADLQ